ncbi:MAG: hypothetical protein CMM47_07920 [Rhodospirillaceae bacterium]|nr:hypothetical protein [Rhodospirillaceae bacterium]
MELRIAFLTRRAKGGVSTKEEAVSADLIRVGRGTENEVYLPDPRVHLHMAVLRSTPDGLFMEAIGTGPLRLNGNVVRNARVAVGDTIGVGPYDICVVDPPEDKDVAITVELTQPMGDDVKELKERSRTSLATAGMSKRAWAWLLFLVVAIGFIGLPIGTRFMHSDDNTGGPLSVAHKEQISFDIAWKSGEMMDAHKFFADDCAACHVKPFEMTTNQACAVCHADEPHHADPVKFPRADLVQARCADCHKDHQGPTPLKIENQTLCADCHRDLKSGSPSTTLENASDFGSDHPEFKPTVSTDPSKNVWTRISLADNPKEVSDLKFPHKTHLDPKRMRRPDGKSATLECASCHVEEPGGGLMVKIDMETHCSDCHRLTFDKLAPDRVVSHGKPKQVVLELREYYAARALEGGVPEKTAPAVVRRRPGTKLTEPQRKEALGWAKEKWDWAARYIFSASQCGSCHMLIKDGPIEDWTVKPVRVTARWQPLSFFSHDSHHEMNCVDCHEASTSVSSADVLLPKIDSCRDCHSGGNSTSMVPSTCIMCHEFHTPGQPPMVKLKETAQK